MSSWSCGQRRSGKHFLSRTGEWSLIIPACPFMGVTTSRCNLLDKYNTVLLLLLGEEAVVMTLKQRKIAFFLLAHKSNSKQTCLLLLTTCSANPAAAAAAVSQGKFSC